MLYAVDGLCQPVKIVKIIVTVLGAVRVTGTGFHILHKPVSQVIVVSGLAARGGVCHGCQGAGVIILVRNGAAVLKGFQNHPALAVIIIGHIIAVAVGQLVQIPVLIRGVFVACQSSAVFPEGSSPPGI